MQQSQQLGALCAHRLAEVALLPANDHAQALDALQTAIDLHGCSPELCWSAAFSAYYAGQHERAKGCWPARARQGFRRTSRAARVLQGVIAQGSDFEYI